MFISGRDQQHPGLVVLGILRHDEGRAGLIDEGDAADDLVVGAAGVLGEVVVTDDGYPSRDAISPRGSSTLRTSAFLWLSTLPR